MKPATSLRSLKFRRILRELMDASVEGIKAVTVGSFVGIGIAIGMKLFQLFFGATL